MLSASLTPFLAVAVKWLLCVPLNVIGGKTLLNDRVVNGASGIQFIVQKLNDYQLLSLWRKHTFAPWLLLLHGYTCIAIFAACLCQCDIFLEVLTFSPRGSVTYITAPYDTNVLQCDIQHFTFAE